MTIYSQMRQDFIRQRRQRRKQARQARIRRQIVRYLCLGVIVYLGVGGFLNVPWAVSDVDKDVQVQGNQVVSCQQIKQKLIGCRQKKLYSLNPACLEAQVESLRAIKYAFVRRYLLPHPHLIVNVAEEFPWATFTLCPDKAGKVVIAEDGAMIACDEFPKQPKPELQIIGLPQWQMSQPQVVQWASWITYIEKQTGRQVKYVDLRDPHSIWVQNGDLRLHLGSADPSLTRRLGRLTSIMPVLAVLKEPPQYIDLALDNNIPLKMARTAKH